MIIRKNDNWDRCYVTNGSFIFHHVQTSGNNIMRIALFAKKGLIHGRISRVAKNYPKIHNKANATPTNQQTNGLTKWSIETLACD